mmetsp:Transcript_8362/g.32930  ORF Transcript_8362/g.32930 Transcript_8362/m.32930 type:complete len:227 (+) Transcript_8362:68-748(+)
MYLRDVNNQPNRRRVQFFSAPFPVRQITRRSLPLLPGRGPLDAEDEVIVPVPVQLVDRPLRVVPVDEVDEGEPSGLARLPVERHVDASHGTEGAEQLLEILLAGVLGQVAHADGVLLPPAVHGFSHGRAAAGARAHGRRHVAALAGALAGGAVVVARGFGVAQAEGVHRREVLVRALGGPVVALLAADAADQEGGVAAGHLGELVALLLALGLWRRAVPLQEDLLD